jgi:hypothetical protein
VIIVEVLGYCGGDSSARPDEDECRSRERNQQRSQNPDSPVQVVGTGQLDRAAADRLTAEERKKLVQ